jgi:hypothetical protein
MQLSLENQRIKLAPLKESDSDILWPIAKDIDIFKYGPSDISSLKNSKYIFKLLLAMHL